LKVIVSR